jgi:hypothetical protein
VLLVEPLGQFLHRDRLAHRVPLGSGVLAIPRGGDVSDGAVEVGAGKPKRYILPKLSNGGGRGCLTQKSGMSL